MKEKSEARQKELDKKRKERVARKQAEAEARQQLIREEKEQQARLKREEEDINKEMAKIRRAMEEERRAAGEKLERYVVWFKFLFSLKIFKPVWFLFSFVSEYDNESETKKNIN